MYPPDPQLYKLSHEERTERLRSDAAAWSRRPRTLRRRFGLILIAAGERLGCGAQPRPRHSTP